MLQKAGSWLLSLLILCVATTSLAQVTRHAFEAVRTEDLSVELRDGEIIQGQLRHVDDERAVVLSDDGEVREVLLKDVAHLRIRKISGERTASTAKAGEDATDHAQQRVEESVRTAEGLDQRAPQPQSTTGYFDERTSGYLSSSDASTENPFTRGYDDHRTAQQHQGLALTAIDYDHYQAMIRGSRVKRTIGWSMFATGALFLWGAAHAANRARRYNYDFEYPGLVAFGALNAMTGLPVAIAGRQQYKRAAEFAREAAEGRASILQDRPPAARQSTEGAPAPVQD